MLPHLEHLLDEAVDLLCALATLAALVVVVQLASHAALGAGQLERPEKVVGVAEVGPAGVDLVDEVLHADDALVAEGALHDRVAAQGNALAIHLAETALVHQVLHALQVGVAVGDERLHQTQHLDGGGVQLHKHAVMDLAQAQQLQDLAHLRRDANDTADADHESNLSLSGHVEVALSLGLTAKSHSSLLHLLVLFHIFLSSSEDLALLGAGSLLGNNSISSLLRLDFFQGAALLQHRFGDQSLHHFEQK
mmetsp:Transcript_30390/g.47602  ORF Transcript_30390/g.47602 Transcript_30390/m.47602 type:complete len:250 (-) Transcript_30390:28-777(-)